MTGRCRWGGSGCAGDGGVRRGVGDRRADRGGGGIVLLFADARISAGVALVAYAMSKDDGTKKGPEPSDKLTAADAGRIREMEWDWDTLEMPRLDATLEGLPEKVPGTRRAPLWERAKQAVAGIKDEELDVLILRPAGRRRRRWC